MNRVIFQLESSITAIKGRDMAVADECDDSWGGVQQ